MRASENNDIMQLRLAQALMQTLQLYAALQESLAQVIQSLNRLEEASREQQQQIVLLQLATAPPVRERRRRRRPRKRPRPATE